MAGEILCVVEIEGCGDGGDGLGGGYGFRRGIGVFFLGSGRHGAVVVMGSVAKSTAVYEI